MKKYILGFAQKAFVLNKNRTKLLVIKYRSNIYQNDKLADKYALPGGQINQLEEPDSALTREVQEETSVTIEPGLPFYTWTWNYHKSDGTHKQIVAIARLGRYISGEPTITSQENESVLETTEFIALDEINVENFVHDEYPILEAYYTYTKSNPFS